MIACPLFDTLENLDDTPASIFDYLKSIAVPAVEKEFKLCLEFLKSYGNSPPEWRPFVVRISKIARRHGKQPDKSAYQLSNKSLEAVFATLSSLYTFLQQEDYLEVNPISLIRQKKGIFNDNKYVR